MLILMTMFAVCLACVVIMKSKYDQALLTEQRVALPTTRLQIICGNCSGEGARPVKTLLDRAGYCERCGGRSYLLASNCAVFAHQLNAGLSLSATPALKVEYRDFRRREGDDYEQQD